MLDGTNLGSEDTSAPFALTWNTTLNTNGSHTITARARDAAGNQTTSTGITVTVNNPVPDTTAPSVSISAPSNGSSVSGSVNVTASASDNVGVVGVQFRIDGSNFGSEDTSAPYSISWNTSSVSVGNHTITAVARDSAGNTTTATTINVTVLDTTVPTVSISAPANGSTVSGTSVSISATATDNVGVAGVQFRIDGSNFGSEDTSAPYSISWNTSSYSNANHTITAIARDSAGNTTTSSTITVTVNNVVTPPPPPAAPVVSNVNVSVRQGTATFTWSTNIGASSQVEYGATTSYGQTSTLSSSLVTTHTRVVNSLNAGVYNFRAVSVANSVTGNSGNSTFIVRGRPNRITLVTASPGSIILNWGQVAFEGYAGVAILRSTTGFASTYSATTEIARVTGNSYTDNNVTPGTLYYYSLFVFDDQENYSDPTTVSFTAPTPPPTPTPPPPSPSPSPTPTPTPTPTPGGQTPVVTANHYPTGTIFKYANNPTVYIKEGSVARPITDITVLQNQVPSTRYIITIPDSVTFTTGAVLGLRSGTLIKSSDNPTIYLMVGTTKLPFTSMSMFTDHNYSLSQVYVINDPNLVNSIPTSSDAFIRPVGTLFKYANSPAVYFLNKARLKRGYTTIDMFRIWNANLRDVVTVPTSETYADGPIATLPNGILVKGSTPTIYFVFDGVLRPFTNTTLFNAMGLTFNQVHTFSDADMSLQSIGSPME
jgi:hypothetical protein